MKPLSEIPISRPAATEHSPNRAYRWRSQALKAKTEGRKEGYLASLEAGESEQQAEKRIHAPRKQVYGWEKADPDFRQRCLEALEFRRLEGMVASSELIKKSVEVVGATQDGKNKKVLVYKAASDTLRGMGVWNGNTELPASQSTVQDNRQVIINVLGDPSLRPLLLNLARLMESRTSLRSGEVEPGAMEKSEAS